MNKATIRSDTVDLSSLPPQESGISVAEIQQIIYRRWKPALAAGIIAFSGVFMTTALKTPEYRSQTLILLENPKTDQSASVSPERQSAVNQYYSVKDLSTEIFVLRSNSLVAKAVKTIQHRYPELTVAEVTGRLSVNQTVLNQVPTDIITVAYTDTDPERAKVILEALGSTYVQYSLEKQQLQAANGIKFINAQLPNARQELDEAAKKIRQFRQINKIVDPEASAVETEGVKSALEAQIRETELNIEVKERQIIELDRQLVALNQNAKTMVPFSVLSQDGVYQKLATQLKDLETQYNLDKIDFHETYHVMEDLKSRQRKLKKLLQERAEQVLGGPVSQEVLDRVIINQSSEITASNSGAEANMANDSGASSGAISGSNYSSNAGTSTDESGENLSSQGSIIQTFVNQKIQLKNEIAALKSKLVGLRNNKTRTETDFELIPHLQQTYTELQRQLELKSNTYNYLLQRRQDLEISEAEEIAPWRILDEPGLPSKPISPDIKQGLLQSSIVAIFFAAATAFVMQKLDQRIRQVEEVKQLTRLPIIGVVPKVDNPLIDANIHTTRQSYSYYSSFTEGLRSLAMNLRYLVIESGAVKTLAITSSTSAEGKTTVSYNLGIVLAEFGLRVLIVDADMRKPKIHKLVKITNETGLSDAIALEQPWTDFVQTSRFENLDIITAGETSPNPIALLNSDKMGRLIEEWQRTYDYILIDTPPIGVIADAKSIAKLVDTTVFVVGVQRASRKAFGNALDILYSSHGNIAGVVANMVDPQFDYYAYSYYDSYYNQLTHNDNGDSHDDSDGAGNKISNILQQFRRH